MEGPLKGTKRAVRVFVFRDLSCKLPPHAFRRAFGRNAGIKAISYDVRNGAAVSYNGQPHFLRQNKTRHARICFPRFVMEIAAACVSPRFWAQRWNQRNFLRH